MSFTSCSNKGFMLTFSNGITISVQFGVSNYCEHSSARKFDLDKATDFNAPMKSDMWTSKDAEIAVWYGVNRQHWWNFSTEKWGSCGSDVLGHVTTDEVADYIKLFKNMNLEVHNLLISHIKED